MIGQQFTGSLPPDCQPLLVGLGRKAKRNLSRELTNRVYSHYYNFFMNMIINLFTYHNLPDTVDQRFMELVLNNNGYAVFFEDEVLGHLVLPCTIGGRWDVYNIPITRRAYATSGYQRELSIDDSVIIFNNAMHTPNLNAVQIFAERMTNLDRTIDINIYAQRTPLLIKCPEEALLTMKNLYKDYQVFEPVIFGTKKLGDTPIEVLNTQAPYLVSDLNEAKRQTINDFLSFIGVENTGAEKRERMNMTESSAGMGYVSAARRIMLEERKRACEKINAMFELNIEVEYNNDFEPLAAVMQRQILAADEDSAETEEGGEDI